MSVADREQLKILLPSLDMKLVEYAEVKCSQGACKCGRQMTLLDIVSQAFKNQLHSVSFLEQIFSGKRGKLVVCSAHASDAIKSKMPPNTFFVEDTAPIPCIDCGRTQEIVLCQGFLIHLWIL